MAYDYREAMKADINRWMDDNKKYLEVGEDNIYEKIEEKLWIEDSVTGNASGSYTFSTAKAKEYVEDNYRLLIEAIREFGYDLKFLGEKIDNEEWEYLDVTIRCYILPQILSDMIDEIRRTQV